MKMVLGPMGMKWKIYINMNKFIIYNSINNIIN